MEDLTVEAIISLHSRIIERTGGDSRVLSEATLHQLVLNATMIPQYVKRAAFVFWFLCAYPAFRDGNTQAALAVASRVLESAGYRLTVTRDEDAALADGIAACTIEPDDIEKWLMASVRNDCRENG